MDRNTSSALRAPTRYENGEDTFIKMNKEGIKELEKMAQSLRRQAVESRDYADKYDARAEHIEQLIEEIKRINETQ